MTGEELLEKLELADPAYVQAAAETPAKRRRPRLRRAVLAAACVCLLAGTVAAASGGGTWLLDSFTARGEPGSDFIESGYTLAADVEKFPESALTGEIQRVGAQIVHQYETYSLLSSRTPNFWQMKFSSAAEALDYIGMEGLRGLNWDLEEQQTELRVYGTAQGQLELVVLETDYKAEGVRLQAFTEIYMEYIENGEDPVTFGVRTTEDVVFSDSVYRTAGGKQCQVITDTGRASGYHCMGGYLVADGVLYHLNAAYLKEDEALAESLLHQWADLF